MKLAQWCENGAQKITDDLEGLEMHSAVRNVMRLFDRIKDFDKKVVARQGALGRADSDALLAMRWRCWPSCSALSPRIWPRSCG